MCGVCGVVCVSGWEMYMHAMYEEGSVEGLCVCTVYVQGSFADEGDTMLQQMSANVLKLAPN